MKNLFFLTLVLSTSFLSAQSTGNDFTHLVCDSSVLYSNEYYAPDKVDSNASNLMSRKEMIKYLTDGLESIKNIRNKHGRYFIHFTVDTIGNIENICIARPRNPYPYGRILVENFRKLPNFLPAIKNGKPVPSQNFYPLSFCIGR